MMYMKIIPKLCLTKKGACFFKAPLSVCISIVEKFFVLFIDKVIAATQQLPVSSIPKNPSLYKTFQ